MSQINFFLRVLLSFTFLFSAYTKWIAPGFFEITLIDQGLVNSRQFAALFSRLVIGVEITLGLLVLFPFYLKKVLVLVMILLSVFSAYLIYLWSIGDSENCGCFGETIHMSPLASIFKNLLLIALSTFIYIKTKEVKKRLIVLIFIPSIVLLSVFLFLPIKNVTNFPFQEFTHFKKKGRVDLSEGKNLVVIFNLDCTHCQETAKELKILKQQNKDFPPIYALYFQEGSTSVEKFEEITSTNFPYAFIDAEQFFDLIGTSPPRIYFVKNGRVNTYWDDGFTENIRNQFSLK